jgi:hypothetical protein
MYSTSGCVMLQQRTGRGVRCLSSTLLSFSPSHVLLPTPCCEVDLLLTSPHPSPTPVRMSPVHCTPHSLTHSTHSPTHADWRGAPHGVCQEARVGSHPHGNGNTARALPQGYAQLRACLALLAHTASSPDHPLKPSVLMASQPPSLSHIVTSHGHTLATHFARLPCWRSLTSRVTQACVSCLSLSLIPRRDEHSQVSCWPRAEQSPARTSSSLCSGITSCEARVAIRPGPFFLADLITTTFELHVTSLHHCNERACLCSECGSVP